MIDKKTASFMRSLCMGEIEEEIVVPYPEPTPAEAETLRAVFGTLASMLGPREKDFAAWDRKGENAKRVADVVNCESDYLVKERLDGDTVKMTPKKLDVKGKNVVIQDDIISTGGTMIKAAEMLKKQGAKSVPLGCVHGLFTKGVDIFGKLDVVCTDSLPTKLSKVSLAPIIIKALKA